MWTNLVRHENNAELNLFTFVDRSGAVNSGERLNETTECFTNTAPTLDFDHKRNDRAINYWREFCHRTRELLGQKLPMNLTVLVIWIGFLLACFIFAFLSAFRFPVLTVLWQTFDMRVCSKSWVQQVVNVDHHCIRYGALGFVFSRCFSVILAVCGNSLFVHQVYLENGRANIWKSDEHSLTMQHTCRFRCCLPRMQRKITECEHFTSPALSLFKHLLFWLLGLSYPNFGKFGDLVSRMDHRCLISYSVRVYRKVTIWKQ